MRSLSDGILEARILIVDDERANVQLVERFLEWAGYTNFKSITDSSAAMKEVREYGPDIILLDLHMPAPDGYAILAELNGKASANRFLPVLVFTADATSAARKKALEAGASDFLTKPGDAQEILLRVRNFLQARRMHLELQKHNQDLEARVNARTAELSLARREALETLARAAEYRDDDTGQHTKRVGDLSARIAEAMGEGNEFVEYIRLAAPLHDVGKIALPDSILLKPGPLDEEELQTMRRHTITGGQVFSGIESPMMKLAREIAICHHERWDGSGYPNGLAGDSIPLSARIVSIADVYDALVNERPYKRAWTHEDAVAEIESQSGRQFDPRVVEGFQIAIARRELRHAA